MNIYEGCIVHIRVFKGVWGHLGASRAPYVVWGSHIGLVPKDLKDTSLFILASFSEFHREILRNRLFVFWLSSLVNETMIGQFFERNTAP